MKTEELMILGAILVVMAIVLSSLVGSRVTGYTTWTKAICNNNSCQDFEITCQGKELIDIKPISNIVIFDDSWEDSRPEELKNSWC